MAFIPANLTLASVGSPTTMRVWTYNSEDGYSTTVAADYMVASPQRLAVGDWILINTDDDEHTIAVVLTASTSAATVRVIATDD